jgi:hypothetical protein
MTFLKIIFNKTFFFQLKKKLVNFEVAITEMCRWIPWELVADPLGSSEHTLGTTTIPSAVFFYKKREQELGFRGYS